MDCLDSRSRRTSCRVGFSDLEIVDQLDHKNRVDVDVWNDTHNNSCCCLCSQHNHSMVISEPRTERMSSRYRILTGRTTQIRKIGEALKLTDKNELREEIRLRHELQRQMVGSLYPTIIDEECSRLAERIAQVAHENKI